MQKKHYIKTVEDIKYCEENSIELYDEYQSTVCFRFVDGVWCSYTNKNLNTYNVKLSLNSLYYEEESEEPMQEATADNIGMLCLFWGRTYKDVQLGILEEVSYDDDEVKYLSKDEYWYYHCRPLTKEEIKEFMEKAK